MRPAPAATRWRSQRGAFLRRQRRRDLVFELAPLIVQRRQQAAGLGRQGHSDSAPVRWVGQSLGKPSLFEAVDDDNHCVAMNAKAFGELALGLAVVVSQRQQHRIRSGLGSYRRQAPLEVAADIRTQLCEQKGDSFVEFGDAGVLFTHFMRLTPLVTVTYQDDRGRSP
jgi:hypothetical protein